MPYTTGFERGEIDPQFWTYGSNNSEGVIEATTTNEPKSGDYHLISRTGETGSEATNYADLHLNVAAISNIVLSVS